MVETNNDGYEGGAKKPHFKEYVREEQKLEDVSELAAVCRRENFDNDPGDSIQFGMRK